MRAGLSAPAAGTGPPITLPVRAPYRLRRTLSCGQAFGWRVDTTGAAGIFAGREIRLTQRHDAIVVDGLEDAASVERLGRYLGLDQPLRAIERELARDAVLARILPATSGIAILRQDPWECLAGFVVSAFNNIPKIERTLGHLSRRFGELLPGGGHAFPRPEAIGTASERALRGCILGYRAPYLRTTARRVSTGAFDLRAPSGLPYDEAKRTLLALPGVGEKVADCVLLFAYGKTEAFPVDVWVKRAVERWYFGGRVQSERRIREFARARFGPLAGYAQQHLFVAAREDPAAYRVYTATRQKSVSRTVR
jgi:N-glycosylase/DNA lyase